MSFKEKIGSTLFWLFVVGVISFLVISIATAVGSSHNKRYWISTTDGMHRTDSYEEKDGCIYYTDHYGYENKQCHGYGIKDMEIK